MFQGSENPGESPGIASPPGVLEAAAQRTGVSADQAINPAKLARHLPPRNGEDFCMAQVNRELRSGSVMTDPSCSRASSSSEFPVPPIKNS